MTYNQIQQYTSFEIQPKKEVKAFQDRDQFKRQNFSQLIRDISSGDQRYSMQKKQMKIMTSMFRK